MYQRPYQGASGPVHCRTVRSNAGRPYRGPAWGCKGLDSLRSSIPCPWAFPWLPLVNSRATDANAKAQGQGLRPLHPARSRSPVAVAADAGPSRPFHCRLPFRVAQPAMRGASHDAVYLCSPFLMWKKFRENLKDPIVLDLLSKDLIDDTTPVEVFEEDGFRVRVFRGKDHSCECCGVGCYVLSLEVAGKRRWVSILMMTEAKLWPTMAVLNELGTFLKLERT